MDIMWWLDGAGVLDERHDEVDDIVRARHVASFQLVGSPERATVDLNSLQRLGVRLVGRLGRHHRRRDGPVLGLPAEPVRARRSQARSAARHPRRVGHQGGLDSEAEPPERFPPTDVPAGPPLLLPLTSGEIKTVVWATGYRSEYPWLHVPVLDHKGKVRHDGGSDGLPGPVPDRRHLPAPA